MKTSTTLGIAHSGFFGMAMAHLIGEGRIGTFLFVVLVNAIFLSAIRLAERTGN